MPLNPIPPAGPSYAGQGTYPWSNTLKMTPNPMKPSPQPPGGMAANVAGIQAKTQENAMQNPQPPAGLDPNQQVGQIANQEQAKVIQATDWNQRLQHLIKRRDPDGISDNPFDVAMRKKEGALDTQSESTQPNDPDLLKQRIDNEQEPGNEAEEFLGQFAKASDTVQGGSTNSAPNDPTEEENAVAALTAKYAKGLVSNPNLQKVAEEEGNRELTPQEVRAKAAMMQLSPWFGAESCTKEAIDPSYDFTGEPAEIDFGGGRKAWIIGPDGRTMRHPSKALTIPKRGLGRLGRLGLGGLGGLLASLGGYGLYKHLQGPTTKESHDQTQDPAGVTLYITQFAKASAQDNSAPSQSSVGESGLSFADAGPTTYGLDAWNGINDRLRSSAKGQANPFGGQHKAAASLKNYGTSALMGSLLGGGLGSARTYPEFFEDMTTGAATGAGALGGLEAGGKGGGHLAHKWMKHMQNTGRVMPRLPRLFGGGGGALAKWMGAAPVNPRLKAIAAAIGLGVPAAGALGGMISGGLGAGALAGLPFRKRSSDKEAVHRLAATIPGTPAYRSLQAHRVAEEYGDKILPPKPVTEKKAIMALGRGLMAAGGALGRRVAPKLMSRMNPAMAMPGSKVMGHALKSEVGQGARQAGHTFVNPSVGGRALSRSSQAAMGGAQPMFGSLTDPAARTAFKAMGLGGGALGLGDWAHGMMRPMMGEKGTPYYGGGLLGGYNPMTQGTRHMMGAAGLPTTNQNPYGVQKQSSINLYAEDPVANGFLKACVEDMGLTSEQIKTAVDKVANVNEDLHGKLVEAMEKEAQGIPGAAGQVGWNWLKGMAPKLIGQGVKQTARRGTQQAIGQSAKSLPWQQMAGGTGKQIAGAGARGVGGYAGGGLLDQYLTPMLGLGPDADLGFRYMGALGGVGGKHMLPGTNVGRMSQPWTGGALSQSMRGAAGRYFTGGMADVGTQALTGYDPNLRFMLPAGGVALQHPALRAQMAKGLAGRMGQPGAKRFLQQAAEFTNPNWTPQILQRFGRWAGPKARDFGAQYTESLPAWARIAPHRAMGQGARETLKRPGSYFNKRTGMYEGRLGQSAEQMAKGLAAPAKETAKGWTSGLGNRGLESLGSQWGRRALVGAPLAAAAGVGGINAGLGAVEQRGYEGTQRALGEFVQQPQIQRALQMSNNPMGALDGMVGQMIPGWSNMSPMMKMMLLGGAVTAVGGGMSGSGGLGGAGALMMLAPLLMANMQGAGSAAAPGQGSMTPEAQQGQQATAEAQGEGGEGGGGSWWNPFSWGGQGNEAERVQQSTGEMVGQGTAAS